jgi:uncharacterized membrane protein HdeD (DUF308 family)
MDSEILVYNWWLLAVRGAVAVLFAVLTFLMPDIALGALVSLFGTYAIVDGFCAIMAAFRTQFGEPRSGMLILEGVAGVLAGVLTVMWPGISAFTLLYLIAGWAIVTGVFELSAAIRLRRVVSGEWMMIIAGIASLAFGVAILFAPVASALAMILWIGVYALIFGAILLALALRLRSWGRENHADAMEAW